MVGYFYHLDYLHEDTVAAAPDTFVEPPKKRGRPAKITEASISAPPPSPKVHLIEHAKLFSMAVKYHIPALQDLAAQKFKVEVAEHWDHEDLAHAIHVIYTSTAEDVTQLREVAVEVLNAHRDQLLLQPEITTLLRSITGLACDLLLRDTSSITGRHLTEGRLVLCCKNSKFLSKHNATYELPCPSCGCDMQICEGCNRFQFNCPACGEEL